MVLSGHEAMSHESWDDGVMGSWGHGVMGSWGHGVMRSCGHGVMGRWVNRAHLTYQWAPISGTGHSEARRNPRFGGQPPSACLICKNGSAPEQI
jgi:hypothetical protein